jgi:preprotein translocase subunit SecB
MTNFESENEFSASTTPVFVPRAHYVKDLSFESPSAPHSLLPKGDVPKLEMTVDINAQRFSEDAFEVALQMTARATNSGDGQPLFLVDLVFAGVFTLQNIPEEQVEPLLFIECPNLLFPFARRIIADATRDGGFPPLMLEPIDFHRLYVQRKQQQDAA